MVLLSEDGYLIMVNEKKQLSKWMDIKVKQAFDMNLRMNFIICAGSEGTL